MRLPLLGVLGLGLISTAFGQWQEMAVPVVASHPFSADEVTPRKLSPNLNIAVPETIRVYRDSAGRIRINVPVPQNPASPPPPVIIDPVANSHYILNTDKKIASRSIYSITPGQAVPNTDDPWKPPTGEGLMPFGFPKPSTKTEFLGMQLIGGFMADGRRITTASSGGTNGTASWPASEAIEEDWYSPELQMMVLKQVHTTGLGDSTTRLVNIYRGEPDPTLFQVPTNYTIVEWPGSRTAAIK